MTALGIVYIYIAFTVQFPAGYWDPFTPVPVPQSTLCVAGNFSNDRSAPPLHPTQLRAGWDQDPYIGSWTILPATEDYDFSLAGADRRLVEGLILNAGTTGPKTPRITRFYNLGTEKDWRDHLSGLDEEVKK